MADSSVKAISLFSGAGGMDVGFSAAGVEVIYANEMDHDAAEAYQSNPKYINGAAMHVGDIANEMDAISALEDVDLVFGGPPCQGFSVAGKMDPLDERSKLIWAFMDVVERVRPRFFIMENVKALGVIARWKPVRDGLLLRAEELGYGTTQVVLHAESFGVPQARERFFFLGFRGVESNSVRETFDRQIEKRMQAAPTVREALGQLPSFGELGNEVGSTAAVHLAKHPVLRKSPYRGSLLFNGRGRPIDLDAVSKTLPAQMGGNLTPIIDQSLLDKPDGFNWVAWYHHGLLTGETTPDKEEGNVPASLRRLSVREAASLQTFPADFQFSGRQNKQYRQIGNAVPCRLAQAVAESALQTLREFQE